MRLVTKIHDYYDGAVRTSVSDKTYTFVREPRTIFVKSSPSYETELKKNNDTYTFSFGIVGFCGEIYPFIKVTTELCLSSYRTHTRPVYRYCYDMEEFSKVAALFKESDGKQKGRKYYSLNRRPLFEVAGEWLKNKSLLKKYFYGQLFNADNEIITSIFHDERVAYFFTEGGDYHPSKKAFKYTLYPVLKDLQFFQVMDSYQTFQMIEHYLTNELIRPDDPYIEPVPDKIKAASKGFNKFSFRKDKEKK